MLSLYSQIFDTVEVDSSFYASPTSSTFESWYERSEEGFLFSLKMPREITHELRLRPASYPVAAKFLSRASLLREKLGPFLIQLSPAFVADRGNAKNLRSFLDTLPQGMNFAIEFRDGDWLVDWTFRELESRGIWLCAVEGEWIGRDLWFRALDQMNEIPLYVRFMGARDLDRFDRIRRPQDKLIETWFRKLSERPKCESYVYFSNLLEGFAPASVNKLRNLAGIGTADPEDLRIQESLF
ncbi:MAG: DUF72 domain-containing protein [Acidobacteria bacterium]|nr:MAG: DUF72 domain-containing protein [Acidobacteriota bacterium]REK02844.1 MAG: DUF72 domain-containing protein [Acidobacteriota bacterium]REK13352.1 MAG: DUF72 domain-containing protein [Acidobacteriota bacterium]REK41346.1 MAG: DUF72 domain-containing protein [Acidobacteriota bacterium]